MDKELIGLAFKHMAGSRKAMQNANQCYFINCKQPTIGAHSVSRNAHLLKICDAKNNFLEIRPRFKPSSPEPTYEFSVIGLNQASKFWGFCKLHDEIFSDIDSMTPESEVTPKMEFLLALRAAAREWCVRQSLINFYQRSPELPSDDAFKAFLVEFEKGLNDLRVVRKFFNDNFLAGNFNSINGGHLLVSTSANVAASAAVTPEWGVDGHQINNILSSQILSEPLNPIVGLYVNALPLSDTKSLLAVGWKRTQASRLGDLINFASFHEDSVKNIFTNLLLENAENIYFAKSFVESLEPVQVQWILKKFGASVDPEVKIDVDNPTAAFDEVLKLISPLDSTSKDAVSLFTTG